MCHKIRKVRCKTVKFCNCFWTKWKCWQFPLISAEKALLSRQLALVRRPQKRKYITYSNATRGGPSHGHRYTHTHTHTHARTHTRLTALCSGLAGWAGTRKVKPIWILLKQETVNDSGTSWAICKSAPRSRQITTPAPHHSVFTGRMPFLPPNQQRQSRKYWRHGYR